MRVRSIYLSIMFAGLIAIHGCSTPVQSEAEPPVDFTEFQNSIRQVLFQATVMNYSMPVMSLDQMADNIREAYQTTFGEDAQMDVFDDAARRFVQQPRFSKNAAPQLQSEAESDIFATIIQESSDAREAIIALDELIASGELEEEQTLKAIVIRENIVFLANNSVLLEYLASQQLNEEYVTASQEGDIDDMMANEQRCYDAVAQMQEQMLDMIPCGQAQGWYERWGKCAAGIIGSSLVSATTLGLYGATVGTVTLPFVGTVSGALVGVVVGGVGGAMYGFADFCD